MDRIISADRDRGFPQLCRDLYVLSQEVDPTPAPHRGSHWERRIADVLSMRGFPVMSMPGGIQVHGVLPASGLRHQTDAAIVCSDAYVVGEWKSYTGSVPKNEILRFKAVTDDLYDVISEHQPRRPVLRLFGVAGDASAELRWYAARHGITLIERSRWPAPVLADSSFSWSPSEGPSEIDLYRLRWLSRSLQEVYPRLPDGSLRIMRRLPDPAIKALLVLHDYWSDRLWDLIDSQPIRFDRYAIRLAKRWSSTINDGSKN